MILLAANSHVSLLYLLHFIMVGSFRFFCREIGLDKTEPNPAVVEHACGCVEHACMSKGVYSLPEPQNPLTI